MDGRGASVESANKYKVNFWVDKDKLNIYKYKLNLWTHKDKLKFYKQHLGFLALQHSIYYRNN